MISFKTYKGKYEKDHWSQSPELWSYVKKYTVGGSVYILKVNVTDARFRFIVTSEGTSLHNISPTDPKYQKALKCCFNIAVNVFSHFSKLGIFCQIEFAGNNSMSQEDDKIVLGNKNEPHMPHIHIIGRCPNNFNFNLKGGKYEYKGPNPGKLFNMRLGKQKWSEVIERKDLSPKETKIANVKDFVVWVKKIFNDSK